MKSLWAFVFLCLFAISFAIWGDLISFGKPMSISAATTAPLSEVSSESRKILYSFKSAEESGHPFQLILDKEAALFQPQKFYNFSLDKMPLKDWSTFDRLEMDVFNPNSSNVELFVTLADRLSSDYWSQLNHKQKLRSGWNHLSFSLTQHIGERGSHRFARAVDLKHLSKFFIVIDPDEKEKFKEKSFLIDNISLVKNLEVLPPPEVMAFDFTSEDSLPNHFLKITPKSLYSDSSGYGFISPEVWKVEDSVYADEVSRHSIGLLKGSFKFKVPDGNYSLSLLIDKLGFWDTPFWSQRIVKINGKTVLDSKRLSGKEFLKDFLKFEKITPEAQDHPYDLYMKRILKPEEFQASAKNGFIELEFIGDESAVSLNSLIVWNKKNETVARGFLSDLEKRKKVEFDWMSRSIQAPPLLKDSEFSVSVIHPDFTLGPENPKKNDLKTLSFFGGQGERPYQVLQVSAGEADRKINIKMINLTSKNSKILKGSDFSISEIVYQFTSPDINHETYLLAGKYLREIDSESLIIKKGQTLYLWVQLAINSQMPAGLYTGNLNIFNKSIPIEVEIKNYKLPEVDFPVGFFGLDPLPYTYHKAADYNEIRKKFRYMALEKLAEAGFTTFTGLPEVHLQIENKKMVLDTSDLDELRKKARDLGFKHSIFSYGGQFPKTLLDLSQKPVNMTEESYYQTIAALLKPEFTKSFPAIVYTFSDEAGGYSDKTNQDLKVAEVLKKHFSFIPRGGFSSFTNSNSQKLNNSFDYGFYSQATEKNRKTLEKNQKWGLYNSAPGNFDDPRMSFGLGLFMARKAGLSHLLEWNSAGFNNFPYYDFDGRESDIAIFYPSEDMKLYSTLRFEFATEGLHQFQKLKLLENLLADSKQNSQELKSAKIWLENLKMNNPFSNSLNFTKKESISFQRLQSELNHHLNILL